MKLKFALCRLKLLSYHSKIKYNIPLMSGPNHKNHKDRPVIVFADPEMRDSYLADKYFEWVLFKQIKIG